MTGAVMRDGSWYFRGDWWPFKILRLFNLMEPDRTVISISKLIMWTAWAAMVAILWARPDDWTALLGGAGITATATGNYMWRRKFQNIEPEGDEP